MYNKPSIKIVTTTLCYDILMAVLQKNIEIFSDTRYIKEEAAKLMEKRKLYTRFEPDISESDHDIADILADIRLFESEAKALIMQLIYCVGLYVQPDKKHHLEAKHYKTVH